jgi:hypothetical protein
MMHTVQKFIDYFLGKRSEVRDLDAKDAVLAKTVMDINRKRTHKEIVSVPLISLQQVHELDRDSAQEVIAERAKPLEEHREAILLAGRLTQESLNRYLPSVSAIKVVQENEESFIAYEGNGRLAAMQRVFSPEDAIEVEQYFFDDPETIVRRMNRVRRMNGLID